MRTVLAIALALAGCAALACASVQKATIHTGNIDFGKGVVCSFDYGDADLATCTKPVTQTCSVPLSRGADGACDPADLSQLEFNIGWACEVQAKADAASCSETVVLACKAPLPRATDGTCSP